MHIVRTPGLVTLADQPGLHRLLAALFVLVGALFAMAPWLVVEPLTLIEATGIVSMGLAAIAAGTYILKTSPTSTVTIDTARREIRIRRSSIFGVEHWSSPFHAVVAVDLEEFDSDEGSPCWRPRLRLQDGSSVPLSRLYDLDRASQEQLVDVVKSAMG
jgi:hypothetical protein